MQLVKLLPIHRYCIDIFHILVLQEYWVLAESRIPLKPVLGGVGIVALSNKTDSGVFLYCRFSLFLKDPFFQIIHVYCIAEKK